MVSLGASAHSDEVVPPVVVFEVVLDVAEGDAGELVHAPEMAALTAADKAPSACRLFK